MNDEDGTRRGRRRFLAGTSALAAALAGCTGGLGGDGGGGGDGTVSLSDFRGSGPLVSGRPAPGGTSMDELPDLSGELVVYLGGGEGGRYVDLFELLERRYDGFEVVPNTNTSASLAQTIVTEHENDATRADVFLSVDAGSLGYVADNGAAADLPDAALDPVPAQFRSAAGLWVGVEGRARTVPYNTDALDADAVPEDVMAIPEALAAAHPMGWAPSYGAFQSFVTAMRLVEGPEATKDWLRAMQNAGVETYRDEFFTSQAVADGEVDAGFANHYYALRVRSSRPDAPIDLAFTSGDAGALVNVSGAAVVAGTDRSDLATNFVRHLLSSEAQEFFATVTFGYPMVPEVAPVGGLPTIAELDPPDVDLTKLADIQTTLDLMREVGVL
ncbi:MAG: extracellular solute-binding protein [Halobacteriaceae archaeon]